MSKYICTICGYIYDEDKGYPEADITPGTLWKDIPDSFKCPLCGATKDDFKKVTEERSKIKVSSNTESYAKLPDEIKYSPLELSAIFSNLAKGCEKQYDMEMAGFYNELSSFYNVKSDIDTEPNFENLQNLLNEELDSFFSMVNEIAGKIHDRGSLRALKWAEQVTRMINSHLKKVNSGSIDFIENMNIHVCEICGFIHIGEEKPEICPVCKVPNSKMIKIERGA